VLGEENRLKKVVKRAKMPMFRNKVMKGMDNVRGGTIYTSAAVL
jgi:hypothetical protein